MHKLYITLLLFFSCVVVRAQELHVNKTMFIGGDSCHTMIYDAMITDDEGILFVGFSYCNDRGDIPATESYQQDMNLMIGKVDNNDNLAWIKLYGGTDEDYATNVCKTHDGGYAIIGSTESTDGDITGHQGGRDIWLIKVDAGGNLLWQKTFGSPFQDIPVSVTETETHELLIFGANNGAGGDVPFHNSGEFSFDWIVVKTDELGNKIWCKVYGGTGNESEFGSIVAVGESYYLASASASTDLDCYDTSWFGSANTGGNFHLLKIDTSGSLIWDRSYGGSDGDGAYQAMFDIRDSSLVVVGATLSNDYMLSGNPYGYTEWIIKMNLEGGVIWNKIVGYPGISPTYRHRMNITDSGYVTAYSVGGTTTVGLTDILTNLLDTAGNIVTQKMYGSIFHENVLPVISRHNQIMAIGNGQTPFTEGTNYGQISFGQKAFICYMDYWPVSVESYETSGFISLYPNPLPPNSSLYLNSFAGNKECIIFAYDITGRQVVSTTAKPGAEIHLAPFHLQPGIYFFSISNDAGQRIHSQKIVIE